MNDTSHNIKSQLGDMPTWILPCSLVFFLLVLIGLIIAGLSLKYSKIVYAPITISNTSCLTEMIAKTDGYMIRCIDGSEQSVHQNEVIAIQSYTQSFYEIDSILNEKQNIKVNITQSVAMSVKHYFTNQEKWKSLYAVHAIIDGTVLFTCMDSKFKVKAGEVFATITPLKKTIKGIISMKVCDEIEIGQVVNVKISGYSEKYKLSLKGIVHKISKIQNNQYTIKVTFPISLNKRLIGLINANHPIDGVAEIATIKYRLVDYFFNSLFSKD